MKETKYYKINGKIFKLNDIRKLATFLHNLSRAEPSYSSSSFSIICSDGSEYESENVDIFDENPVSSKKVVVVKLEYRDTRNGNAINIDIQPAYIKSPMTNKISVRGDDRNWVNGSLTQLREIAEGAEPQLILSGLVNLLLIILSSVSTAAVFIFFDNLSRSNNGNPSLTLRSLFTSPPLLNLITYLAIGLYSSTLFVGWLNKMFPNVELQIGPTHTFIEANRRKILYGVITLIVLPIILAVIFK